MQVKAHYCDSCLVVFPFPNPLDARHRDGEGARGWGGFPKLAAVGAMQAVEEFLVSVVEAEVVQQLFRGADDAFGLFRQVRPHAAHGIDALQDIGTQQ